MWDIVREEHSVILLKMTLYTGRKPRIKETVRNFAPSASLPDQTENLLAFQLSQRSAPAAITSGADSRPGINDFHHLLVGIVNHFKWLCDTFGFV